MIDKIFSDIPVVQITHKEYQVRLNEYGEKVTKDHVSRLNADITNGCKISKRSGLVMNDFT